MLTDLNSEALFQDGVNDWINVLIQVLKQEREAILNGHLQVLQEVAVIEGLHTSLQLLPFPLLDPVHCLLPKQRLVFEKSLKTW